MLSRARAAAAALLLGVSAVGGILNPPAAQAASSSGYLMVDEAGHLYPFGSAPFCGHSDMAFFNNKASDVEITPNNQGYWVLIDSGYVDFKDCGMSSSDYISYELNNIVGLADGEKAVSLSALPDGTGYWVFTDRGKALPFGNAMFYGDMANVPLNGPILGSVATPTGKGYWMVGSDGGIFSFGDAKFSGSTGGIKLNKPIMSMAPDPDGQGYWLVASDGGIFAFDAAFQGSMGATKLNRPVAGMVPGSNGYMMVGEDGGIFSFGEVAFLGSLGATPPSSPIRAVSLWNAFTLGGAGGGGNPAPPPPAPPAPPAPEPVYEWVTVVDAIADQGMYQTLQFQSEGNGLDIIHSCDGSLSETPQFSCWFHVYNSAGELEDMWGLVASTDIDPRHHFVAVDPGTYYVSVEPIDNDYIWGLLVLDKQCTANCG